MGMRISWKSLEIKADTVWEKPYNREHAQTPTGQVIGG